MKRDPERVVQEEIKLQMLRDKDREDNRCYETTAWRHKRELIKGKQERRRWPAE